jgi:hypothetical protein
MKKLGLFVLHGVICLYHGHYTRKQKYLCDWALFLSLLFKISDWQIIIVCIDEMQCDKILKSVLIDI